MASGEGIFSGHYVDFADYSKIIARGDNWREAFQEVFRERDATLVKVKELEQIRNDVAHSRDLSDLQLDTLHLNVRYLMAVLDGYSANRANRQAAAAVAEAV